MLHRALSKSEMTSTKQEKVSLNHASDEQFVSRLHKELLQFNYYKWLQDLNRDFSKEDTQTAINTGKMLNII